MMFPHIQESGDGWRRMHNRCRDESALQESHSHWFWNARIQYSITPIWYSSTTLSSWVSDSTSVLLQVLFPNSNPCWTPSIAFVFASSISADSMPPGIVIIWFKQVYQKLDERGVRVPAVLTTSQSEKVNFQRLTKCLRSSSLQPYKEQDWCLLPTDYWLSR